MTSGAAWNTRPFRPEALEAAREAARRSGLSLAEWLNSAILDTAADAGVRAWRRRYGADDLGPEDDALALIGERLDRIAHRIDRLSQRGNEPDARRPDSMSARSTPEIRTSMRTIEARLASMIRELVPQSQAATQRLADMISELNSRLDRPGGWPPASGDHTTHPAAIDRALGLTEDDRATSRDRSAGLSDALAEISARQRELDTEIAGAQEFSRLEQQLRHITEQIETLRRPADARDAAIVGTDPAAAFERIESKMLDLAQKLDASDARLDSLGAIERSIADLTLQLKETRAAAVEEAERAASAIASEMLADSGATAGEIEVLKQELSEVRTSQAEIEHRTEDALEVVHGTLERLVDRLATIESGVRAAGRSPAETQESRFVSGLRSGTAAPPLSPDPPPEHWALDSDLPADHPLEPGSGTPLGRASAATRIAASDAVQANPVPTEPAAKANFIAAARRAAQAAAAETTDPAGPAGAPAKGAAGLAAAVANRRRPLMIAAGVLLLGAGSLHVGLNGHFLPLPTLKNSGSIETPRSTSEETTSRTGIVKSAAGESRAVAAPDPVVPESGSPATRHPASAAGNEFLLSPVRDGSVTPAADSQASIPARAAPSPAARASEVTGSLPPLSQAQTAAPAGGRAAREPAPEAADKLPNTLGNAALRSAAAAGNAAAEYEIGIRYSEGRGVAQSFEEAAHWLARAAEHGLAPAQYRLGSLYEKGQGVKKDLMEARRLYLAAARQGNAEAMHNLAVLYAVGLESGPDYKAASEWFHKAANHGVADSQYNLGILYARGVGVEQNLTESYKWFALAAQQGDKDAGKKRDDVAARLDPQGLVAARLAVQTFMADPQPDKATKVEPPGGDGALPSAPSAKSKPGRKAGASGSA